MRREEGWNKRENMMSVQVIKIVKNEIYHIIFLSPSVITDNSSNGTLNASNLSKQKWVQQQQQNVKKIGAGSTGASETHLMFS